MLAKFIIMIAGAVGAMAPLPPVPLRHNPDRQISITIADPILVHLLCGGKLGDSGTIIACSEVNGSRMIIPNPCAHKEESYARLLCHELGHTNGWSVDHPNPMDQ